jgi:hypothetical protein
MTRAICLQFLSLFLILFFSNCASTTNNKGANVINENNKSLRKTKDLGQVGLSEKIAESKNKSAPIQAEPSLLKINDPSNMPTNNPSAHSEETKQLSSDSGELVNSESVTLTNSNNHSSDLNSTEAVSKIKSNLELNAQNISSEKIAQPVEKITKVLTEPSGDKTEVLINAPKNNLSSHSKETEGLNSVIKESVPSEEPALLNESLDNQFSDLNSTAVKAEINAPVLDVLAPVADLTFREQQKVLITENTLNDKDKGEQNIAENQETDHFIDVNNSNFSDLVKPQISRALEESVNEARPIESYFSPGGGSDQEEKNKNIETDHSTKRETGPSLVKESSPIQNLENQLIKSKFDNMGNKEVKIGFKDLNLTQAPLVPEKKTIFSDKNELKPFGTRNINASPEVFFNDRVIQQSGVESPTDDKSIAFREKKVSFDSNKKNSLPKVGFKNSDTKSIDLEPGTSKSSKIKQSDKEVYGSGKLQTFLNRTVSESDDELPSSKNAFPLTENFLETGTEIEGDILPSRGQALKPSRYLKTLKWIETRGRTSTGNNVK